MIIHREKRREIDREIYSCFIDIQRKKRDEHRERRDKHREKEREPEKIGQYIQQGVKKEL